MSFNLSEVIHIVSTFDDRDVAELNGSFKKGFKQIREFDRQNTSTAQSNHTTIDRVSFGLAEVN